MNKILLPLMLLMLFSPALMAEEDDELRDRYGMNQKEWQIFKELGISDSKLERLIKCGININEYQSRPWMSMGVSESDWMSERCEGLEDEEIDAFHDSKASGNSEVLLSLILPGFYHWKHKDFKKAAALTTVFVTCGTLYMLHTSSDTTSVLVDGNPEDLIENRNRPAYLFIAAADMITSMVLAITDKKKAKKASDLEEEVYLERKLNINYTMLNTRTSGLRLSYKF